MPASWRVENGSLLSRRITGESFGDIITVEQFADFELVWEWKMTAGNNSGVIYRASEELANVWETGPEYQILDNQGHLDGLNPLSSAGHIRVPPVGTRPGRSASGTVARHRSQSRRILDEWRKPFEYDVGTRWQLTSRRANSSWPPIA